MQRSSSPSSQFLVSRTHNWLCALPIEHVVETMRPQPCEPLANTPPFLLGLSIIRGAAVPVVDVAMLLGAAHPAEAARLVTLRAGDRRVAIAVEAVMGVRSLTRPSIEEAPALLQHTADDAVDAIGALDEQLLYLLRSACLLPESSWQTIAAIPDRS
jgi:purine-binding chemotaxis protein CheW